MAVGPAVNRVVVVVADPARVDEVAGDAQALVESGYRVTVLGLGSRPATVTTGGVRVRHVEVRRTLSEARDARRERRRDWAPPLGFRGAQRAAAARSRVAARRLAAAAGPAPALRDAALTAAAGGVEAWAAVGGATRAGWRALWQAGDVAAERITVGPLLPHVAPVVDDHDAALGPALDRLDPDVVHVIGLPGLVPAVRAALRIRRTGRPVRVLYEAAPGDAVVGDSPRDRAAWARLRRQWSRWATTVAPGSLRDDVARSRLYAEVPATVGTPTAGPATVGIGPANMAGQAWQWAKALERRTPSLRTEVLMVDRLSRLTFPADELVPLAAYTGDPGWRERTEERVLGTWTHALLEAGRPVLGLRYGRTFLGDAHRMQRAGIRVGLVLHGSEVRDPRRHAAAHRWSPFRDPDEPWVQNLQAAVDLLRPDIEAFDGPCLVSTPDLLEDLPDATWLPVVVDRTVWVPREQPPARDVPVVVHVPSRATVKGSSHIDEAVRPLAEQGLVEYRRLEGVAPEQMPAVLADADVVLDQFAIASYGVLASEAMSSGIPVIGHVRPEVRAAVLAWTGHELPVIEADPETLQDVLRALVDDRRPLEDAAAAGPRFAAAVHDGTLSARVLAETLEIT